MPGQLGGKMSDMTGRGPEPRQCTLINDQPPDSVCPGPVGVQRDILPLPAFPSTAGGKKMSGPSLNRRVRRRAGARIHWETWAADAVLALNDLGGAGRFDAGRVRPSAGQQVCLDHIRTVYREVEGPPSDLEPVGALSELCGSAAGYHFNAAPRSTLQLDKLSLPPLDIKHTPWVNAIAGGEDPIGPTWEANLLRDPAAAALLRKDLGLDRPFTDPVHRQGKRYGELLAALSARGLIELGPLASPTCGFFTVAKKDGRQRFIIDTRIANLTFIDPPHTDLPTAAAFSRIEVEPGQALYVAEADVDNAFHRVLLPPRYRRALYPGRN